MDKEFSEYMEELVALVQAGLGIRLIKEMQVYEKPKYPFGAYGIISFRTAAELNERENVLVEQTTFVRDRHMRQVEMMVSFTIVDNSLALKEELVQAKSAYRCAEIAEKLRHWLLYAGYGALATRNIIVVDCSAVGDRDSFQLTDYERRWGFDARLRIYRETVDLIPTIDIVEINGEEILL